MKSNKNITLVGMMGSGKSTIGFLLAKKLNLRFFDTDFIIEKKAKMKISEIFEKKGEVEFRNLEKKVVLKFLSKPFSVISLGGGAFTNEIIRKETQKKCICIWLNWSSKTLIDRIKKNKKRPLALNLNDNQLKDLIFKRSKIYSKAEYKIDCENKSKSEIINKIREITNI
tara:strand:- start:2427 stop:2936 length:510 start_codon:yes stop_codon:yes gene_type:complete